ncbi:MAG: hypothetical protein RL095_1768 [Verrucomicrobiota bacterium]
MGRHGEGTLINRNGTWVHKTRINGKDTRRSTGCTNRKDAEAWVKANITPIASAKNADEARERVREIRSNAARVSLADAYELFTRSPRKKQAGEKQARTVLAYWNDFFTWAEAHELKHLAQITPEHAAAYLNRLTEFGRFADSRPGVAPKPISARSRNAYHINIKAVFQAGLSAASLKHNPFDLPKAENDSEEREAFELDELRRIGEAVKGHATLWPLVIIATCTGLRAGDACCLTWEEVDLDGFPGFIVKKTSKTGKAVSIPMLPPLRELLEELKAKSETPNLKTALGEQASMEQYVCPALASQYQRNACKLSHDFGAVLDRLGIARERNVAGRSRPHVFKDLHSFRHTFVYLAAEAGIPLAVVQGIVGHATQRMTQHYANHATKLAKIEHMKKLPDFFGAQVTSDESVKVLTGNASVKVSGHDSASLVTGDADRLLAIEKILRGATKDTAWKDIKRALIELEE